MASPKHNFPLSHPARFIGTWFGVGLAPKAAGTFGSIAALPFAYLIQTCWGNAGLLIASLIVFITGVICNHIYMRHVDDADPREMVIDEVAGQWLLLAYMYPTFTSYCIGLALFRFFDIVKPWPISWADKNIHGGFGVMFDDILAALYPVALIGCANIVSHYLHHPLDMGYIQLFLSQHYVF
jgi:phosphatidylglycerophosphatase A